MSPVNLNNQAVTLLDSIQTTTSSSWQSIIGFPNWSVHIEGIATTTGQTVVIQGTCKNPLPTTITTDDITISTHTADAIVTNNIPLTGIKVEVEAYAGTSTSGTISAYLVCYA